MTSKPRARRRVVHKSICRDNDPVYRFVECVEHIMETKKTSYHWKFVTCLRCLARKKRGDK
jgi:hypothetical protein